MSARVFLTGFPGFIARRLTERLNQKAPDTHFSLLVEERFRAVAEAALTRLKLRGECLVGDVTRPDLGLSDRTYRDVAATATHVWHLAALYDLAAPAAHAYRVNVVGTANVLDFAERATGLARFDYVSTCYVSGARTGVVLETELDCGQTFKNHYEATKCWAEIEVRRRMHRVPATIHRPSVVVGDSRTGETEKYDGPYFILKLLDRMPRWTPLFHVGRAAAPANLVPVDWVVEAMLEIWGRAESLGKTVHLADPHPHSARETLDAMARHLGFKKPRGALPPRLVENALALRAVRTRVRVPREAIAYFNVDVRFDTENQRKLLEGTSLRCPDFLTILPLLTDYMRRHPETPVPNGV